MRRALMDLLWVAGQGAVLASGVAVLVGGLATIMLIVALTAGVAQILLIALVVLVEVVFVVYAVSLLFRDGC
jgi:hypothetical protein